jgi:hypothetical protein
MTNDDQNIELPEDSDLKHLQLFFYLIPVFGFFPSLWTLYRHNRAIGGLELEIRDEQGIRGLELETREKSLTSPSRRAKREQLAVSRLSVTLALCWLLSYLLLNIGAETTEFLALRLLVLNSLLTSGYFLVSFWLMLRLVSRRSVRVPGFTALAERLLGK